ncbi:MAG: 16S rRNA (guanine(527)-N(7))-methyltransferase RsmG [Flavobacteriaceae bacterium]|nr:16S rRNA (guanine(527)-N(7))-methyltransferase RsmG [Flavobacteriaceae bacterium]
MEIIKKYFPDLTEVQESRFEQLRPLYEYWNSRINVVSRKDIAQLYERHVLHALGIAKVIQFKPGSNILDVGTGGGFPGIPLAILFPECNFHLIDSIQKKIKVVNAISESLELENVTASQLRAQDVQGNYDFIISRAVTAMPRFAGWVQGKISKSGFNDKPNGILYLKGGDLEEELKEFKHVEIYPLSDYFEEEFFDTKKVVYLKL